MNRTPARLDESLQNLQEAPYVIAEMACAHEGEPKRARALIDAARDAGADAIQLQIFRADHQVGPAHDLRPLLEKLEMPFDAWTGLLEYSEGEQIDTFVFAYDAPSLEFALDHAIDGIKLSSADLSNPDLLEAAGASGLPVTLGTGASTLDEIARGLHAVESAGPGRVILMHGVQNFPTRIQDANLRRMDLLARTFERSVGYQDHSDPTLPIAHEIDLVALGMGARILEKHITLDRSEEGTDHEAALEPEELERYVDRVRAAGEAVGQATIVQLTKSDRRYRKFQKKAIVPERNLEQGTVLRREDLRFIRVGEEPPIPPSEIAELVGAELTAPLRAFEPVRWDVVDR